jgi:hypothetical protein
VGVARIGKLDRQRADRGLVEGGKDFFERDIVDEWRSVSPHHAIGRAGRAGECGVFKPTRIRFILTVTAV